MLIETKVKVSRNIDGKTRKRTETYLIDREIFAAAEYSVSAQLAMEQETGVVTNYEIQSIRLSPVKEVATQYEGAYSFIATLKDIFLDDDGSEKHLRYKVLLWADSLATANMRALELSHQGYNMLIEGIKQVDYEYITSTETLVASSDSPAE